MKSNFLGLYDEDLNLFMSLMLFFGVFDYFFIKRITMLTFYNIDD